MRDENPPDPPPVLYSPPAPEAVDAFARQVCQRLGTDYMEHEIVDGFSAFIKVVANIQTKHLNKQGKSSESS
ncbi:MAG: hypothetical protein F9K27_15875 [Anaerolineae bacterium]|nr:MAG: hypothetical protein F9K27_15875 [Anaerolineae bacterium]